MSDHKNSLTTLEVLERFQRAHGETYDYSEFEYVNSSTPGTIICRDHGEFSQRPNLHWGGAGCNKCRYEARVGIYRDTKEEVLRKFYEVHGERYSYELFEEYQGTDIKIPIVCSDHGEFQLSPRNHWAGTGCWDCSREVHPRQYSQGKVLEIFHEIHGNLYDYSSVEYVKNNYKVSIICKTHGVFQQSPQSHWNGRGCPSCAEQIYVSKPESIWATFLKENLCGSLKPTYYVTEGGRGAVDMYFECTTHGRFVIEYDGQYWHSLPESYRKDLTKTEKLSNLGIRVVRLRAVEKASKPVLPDIPGAINIHISSGPTEKYLDEIKTKLGIK